MANDSPLLLIAWRRPHTLRQVIDAIRPVAPTRLFVACDGPNPDRPGEVEKVSATRAVIENEIDWPCHIERLYSDTNLGCRLGVSRAISWFFQHVEEGIILEDDCVPHPDFFPYCNTLLKRYRDDSSIAIISGYNKAGKWRDCDKVFYFFSNHGGIWGWASWASTWKQYETSLLRFYQDFKQLQYEKRLGAKHGSIRIHQLLSVELSKRVDSWDYIWACDRNRIGGLACVPTRSLIVNIGFDADATHTNWSKQQRYPQLAHGWFDPEWLPTNNQVDNRYDKLHLESSWPGFRIISLIVSIAMQRIKSCRASSGYRLQNSSESDRPKAPLLDQSGWSTIVIPGMEERQALSARLIAAYKKILDTGLADIYLHGSQADHSTTLFSDVDDLIILRSERKTANRNKQRILRRYIEESERRIQRIDPLQHHGHFIVEEDALTSYDESYFPLYILNNGIALGQSRREISYSADSNKTLHGLEANLRNTLFHAFTLYNKYETGRITNFEMKSLIGDFLICPAYAFQLAGIKIDKESAIYRGSQYFSPKSQALLRICTFIRNNWIPVNLPRRAIISIASYLPITPKYLRVFARIAGGKFPRGKFPYIKRSHLTEFSNDCLNTAGLSIFERSPMSTHYD